MITLPKAKPGGAAAFRGRGEMMMKEMSDAESTEPAPAQIGALIVPAQSRHGGSQRRAP